MAMSLQNKLLVTLVVVVVLANYGCCKLRFANIFGDHMVLQRAPRRAILWGYADVYWDTVTVLKNGVNVGHTTVLRNATGFEGIWKLKLPAEGNPGPYSITVKSSEGEITINDVMFGDVWICSGQSNMQFTMREVNNSMEEIDNSVNYTDVRMFFTKLQPSGVPLHNALVDTPWIRPVKGIIDQFSALCFMFGRNLYDQYKYPIGLIESNWGGTPIEVWSSPDATATCANSGRKRALWPTSPGVLWNSMIHPFLNMTIYGAIWYQGTSRIKHSAIVVWIDGHFLINLSAGAFEVLPMSPLTNMLFTTSTNGSTIGTNVTNISNHWLLILYPNLGRGQNNHHGKIASFNTAIL